MTAELEPPIPTLMPKRRHLLLLAMPVFVALAALGYGAYWWLEGRFRESTDNAYVAADMVIVAPKIAGYVVDLPAKENHPIRAGDVLFRVDPADFHASESEAVAQAETQRRVIASFAASTAMQRQRAAAAQAQVQRAAAQTVVAAQDADSTRELIARGVLPRRRADAVEGALAAAEASLSAARADAEAAQQQLILVGSQRSAAQSTLAEAQARLASRRLDLTRTVVRAPVSGIVANRLVRAGQYVRPGTIALQIVPLGHVYVIANFKETQVKNLRIGLPVDIVVDAFPAQHFSGRIASLSPATGSQFSLIPAENATGNFTKIVQRIPVRIEISDRAAIKARLAPGMSVEITVDVR
ncbi:efflux RND transporter periplasmic adaptor subunit [uncultured Sphingomonas sp.]|uniref:efflux RND transporter periplasmic adaptor subunit n=1 Tax=uncultured Sphingomonas sp. TaxID=158754 RepID=UPI0035CC6317